MAIKNTAIKNAPIKNAALKSAALKSATVKAGALKANPLKTNALKTASLKPGATLKPVEKIELVHSHPTMCLHCHLIVEMFHERGADPVKGAWQCPRCNHKYLFSHWKIKRQARSKTEAA